MDLPFCGLGSKHRPEHFAAQGMNNIFDLDPPFVAGAFENNYDESLATIKGRFWYIQLNERFKSFFVVAKALPVTAKGFAATAKRLEIVFEAT